MEEDLNYNLKDFKEWFADNSLCLDMSHYPSQVASCVSKYLWHSTAGNPEGIPSDSSGDTLPGIWRNFFHVPHIDVWLKQRSKGVRASSLYNDANALKKASIFLTVRHSAAVPECFSRYIEFKMRYYRRKRRSENMLLIEQQEDTGVPSTNPLLSALKSNSGMTRFIDIAEKSRTIIQCKGRKVLPMEDFLFAMRLALTYMVCSMALRPSAVYTLTVAQVGRAVGNWGDNSAILMKNQSHKTSASRGHSRIILSGKGKQIVSVYMDIIRPAALQTLGIAQCPQVFFNSNGRALCANTLNKQLSALQRHFGIHKHSTCTDIRKYVTTKIRNDTTLPGNEIGKALAEALCHSLRTSDRHYRLQHRDQSALQMHQCILNLFEI